MIERENVIRGLEACQVEEDGCTTLCKANGCPYNVSSTHCMTNLHKDALALLKENEPEKPMLCWGDGLTNWLICGACRHPIDPGDKFCRECGKAVEQYESRH